MKRNHLLVLYWLILFAVVQGKVGTVLGIPLLFLDPEYQNQTGFWSFFIMGASIGIFCMSFFITCYILDAHRFAFLGTLRKPFTKYALNNSIIPFLFIIHYLFCLAFFQAESEFNDAWSIFVKCLAFLLGLGSILLILFAYFVSTNKDIFIILSNNVDKRLKKAKVTRLNVMQRYKQDKNKHSRILNYLDLDFRFKSVSNKVQYYDKESILKVFDQNNFNALSIQIFIFVLIIISGIFRDTPFFQIPSAASAVLLLAFLIMLTGAMSYWFRGWSTTLLLILVFLVNILGGIGMFKGTHQAFGLDYEKEKVPYDISYLKKKYNAEKLTADKANTIQILDLWRSQFPDSIPPKMAVIAASGGGLRASYWTYLNLSRINKDTEIIKEHAKLMTGASGGVLGLSYFRELLLQERSQTAVNYAQGEKNISNELLNPIIFSLLVHDLFIKYQHFDYDNKSYVKDRGFSFEQKLDENTKGVMNKPISAYRKAESDGIIPLLIMAPTIINDGRKAFISAQPVSYMCADASNPNDKIKGIDLVDFFKDQNGDQLRFLSAVRMCATFPYVSPYVALPSEPVLEIMDSGISDNFGVDDATYFLYTFKDWIKENTSGVVMITIRDTPKHATSVLSERKSLLNRVIDPISNLYSNWNEIQDINNDKRIEFIQKWFDFEQVILAYEVDDKMSENDIIKEEKASLSWRLTTKEKNSIKNSLNHPNNVKARERLYQIFSKNNGFTSNDTID